MLIEAVTMSEGFILNEAIDDPALIAQIKAESPAAFSMYLEMSETSQTPSEIAH